ncbi:Rieske (2Fe-2S) protein [Natrarchaeobius oligotrophus]|uniref:Rieske (2Fe-2S) protein n=1 Tax=Natrarchaeobius chitinivorans TaxID=1679083 RepID=A0A3N6MEK2_NATCH|nr:Rieske (2Fe-2S) protein [Natrarchaeobius chitinivorans]RQH02329.1 Rieske (2Fe-2S) protein [Natrarchaeobius chitinivorans]
MTEHVVASVDEIPNGNGKAVEVDGLPIAIFNVEGDYYAISNRCVHMGGPLGEGVLHSELPTVDPDRTSVHCPWHYWEFDLETGRSVVNDKTGLRTFDVSVEDGEIVVDL